MPLFAQEQCREQRVIELGSKAVILPTYSSRDVLSQGHIKRFDQWACSSRVQLFAMSAQSNCTLKSSFRMKSVTSHVHERATFVAIVHLCTYLWSQR